MSSKSNYLRSIPKNSTLNSEELEEKKAFKAAIEDAKLTNDELIDLTFLYYNFVRKWVDKFRKVEGIYNASKFEEHMGK